MFECQLWLFVEGECWDVSTKRKTAADADELCDLCHGTAMRWVIWWTFQKEFEEGQYGSGLNNEMFVSPCTIYIMCCFSSCHMKIPMVVLTTTKIIRQIFLTGLTQQSKQDNLTPCYFIMLMENKMLLIRLPILNNVNYAIFHFSICTLPEMFKKCRTVKVIKSHGNTNVHWRISVAS